MSYQDTVTALAEDAEQLEEVYRAAREAGRGEAFKQAIDEGYQRAPENLLYAAWFYRLRDTVAQARGHVVAWGWVLPLAVANALLFWWLSDNRFAIVMRGFGGTGRTFAPAIVLLAAVLSAIAVLVYLAANGAGRPRLAALTGVVLLAAAGYVLLAYPRVGTLPFQEQYLTLMVMHLALLAWLGVGAFLVAGRPDAAHRFGFLIKSLEVAILGGLFAIAGGLFTGITLGLFGALNIEFPDAVMRLFIAGGAGLIPVVAAAVIYNPARPPAGQAFDEGLSKLVALLMRVLLPLALLVLGVYLAFIPFNFRAPFDNREVLIIYNGMLFAVVVLVIGATPVPRAVLSPRVARWLRLGIAAVAALALIVSVYALAAIVYRTALDRLTPNRLAFIGWNVVNIGLLVLVLVLPARAGEGRRPDGLYRAYGIGLVAYAAWTLIVLLAIPWLFGLNQGQVSALPDSVQRIVYEQPAPIVLKCASSPHLYLLDRGQKRWIENMEVFGRRGYVWGDVRFIGCAELRRIPDGVPIPADAGPPPQP